MTVEVSMEEMQKRLVRYRELKPCTTAFLDTRTPGSERKENFTIIGPGVSESPDQYVHIRLHHGFNIGAARQPPGCSNSQHSHDTAEVFVVHGGTWRFKTGVDGKDGFVDLGPGDTISIPIHAFRGFENIGCDLGFMFSVLGGDVPGRVTWAPHVFEAAERHGLVLLDSGQLLDTTREQMPSNAVPQRRVTHTDLTEYKRLDSAALETCLAKSSQLKPGGGLSHMPGFSECPVIGDANTEEGMVAAPLAWRHGFHVRALTIEPGAKSAPHTREEVEVLIVHAGRVDFHWVGGSLTLEAGDTFTVPVRLPRLYANSGQDTACVYVVRGGDQPGAASIVPKL